MPPLTDGSSPDGDASGPEDLGPGRPETQPVEADRGPEDTHGIETPDQGPRRHPSTIGGAFYLVILATTVAGLVIVSAGRWRTGVHWMAGALVAAALLRVVLPGRDAGMLAVRSRWFDAGLLAGIGVALWVLATSIPDAT